MEFGAAYIRVSTDDQLEYSPDSQLKLVRDEAARRGYVIPDEYVYQDDGISGKSAAKRTAFQRMIAVAKQKPKPFDAIYLWKFSRFARNQEESIVYKSMLSKLGIAVISISEPIIEGPFGSLIERILEWQDEYYVINLATEVKRGMLEKLSRGEPVCRPPVGYGQVNGAYVPDETTPIVQRVFSDYAAGKGMRTIAAELGAEGVRTMRGGTPDNRWIEYMLNNPVYIGKLRWSPDGRSASKRNYHDPHVLIVDGKHEPIISRELWDAVQLRLRQQKERYGKYQRSECPAEYILKGLIRCSACGSTLIRVTSAKRPEALQCHSYARGACHTSHHIFSHKAVAALIDALTYAVDTLDFEVAPTSGVHRTQTTDYRKLISTEETKLSRATDAYLGGAFSLEQYAKVKSDIEARIADLRWKEQAQNNPPQIDKLAFAAKVRAVIDLLQSDATPDAKNKSLRTIMSHAVYEKSQSRMAVYFYN